jgi:hypothetical protein
MANSWREFIFSLAIYFSKLPNHDIFQVNFDELLEMLYGAICINFYSHFITAAPKHPSPLVLRVSGEKLAVMPPSPSVRA